tara:strand:- start:4019 stop:4477 length:459 start_codon:yes stop_codon:yes gene_type:complete
MAMPYEKYKSSNIFFGEPIKNTIIENSVFRRIIYSQPEISFNSINIYFTFNYITIKKFYNKWKCVINDPINKTNLLNIENTILNKLNINNKKPIYGITQQVQNNVIKIFSDRMTSGEFIDYTIVLRISGIWESDKEYGITFKFVDYREKNKM